MCSDGNSTWQRYTKLCVLSEFGITLPSTISVRTHDSNADMRYMVLPKRPEGTENWSHSKLESIISRDALVGVSIPNIEDYNRETDG